MGTGAAEASGAVIVHTFFFAACTLLRSSVLGAAGSALSAAVAVSAAPTEATWAVDAAEEDGACPPGPPVAGAV